MTRKNGSLHHNAVPVDAFEVYIKKIGSFGSISEAHELTGADMSTIDLQIKTRQIKINGLVFRLKDEIKIDTNEFFKWDMKGEKR